MIKWIYIALILVSGNLYSQHQKLETVEVSAYKIESAEGHRKDHLSSDSLKKFQALNLSEALRQNTALFVRSYGANGIATLSVRGTGANHNMVYWNHVDISPRNLGLMDLSLLQLNSSESLDIDYGVGSMPLGAGSLGAGLQINTSAQWQQAPRSNLSLNWGLPIGLYQVRNFNEYGAGNWRGQSSVSYSYLENNFLYRLPGEEQRNRRLESNEMDQVHVKQSLFRRIGEKALWSAKLWYNQSRRSLSDNILGDPNSPDKMLDKNLYLTTDYSYQGTKYRWFANIAYVNSLNQFEAFEAATTNNRFQSLQSQVRLNHRGKKWNQEAALQYRYDLAQSEAYANEEGLRTVFMLFWRGSYQWNKYHKTNIQLREEFYLSDRFYSPLLGSVSQMLNINPNLSFSLAYARNYRIASLNDIYWGGFQNNISNAAPSLKPEQSEQWEIKVDWNLKWGRWTLNNQGSAYRGQIKNWILWAPQGLFWAPQNLREVRNQGLEWSSRIERDFGPLESSLVLRAEWVQSLNQINEELELELPYIPNSNYHGQLNLGYKNWLCSYQINYSNSYFTDEGNRYFMPSYFLQDLSLSYRLKLKKHHWRFRASLHNLADIDYQIIPWRPEAGLHFRLGILWQWQKK